MLHFLGVKIQLGLKPQRCNLTHPVYSELHGLGYVKWAVVDTFGVARWAVVKPDAANFSAAKK